MFESGKIYTRTALHRKYGGQKQGGISTPKGQPFVLLFTSKTGEKYGYQDGWDENGIFRYSGEGQHGDMAFRAGNKAIRDHVKYGKDLHLFEQAKKGQVRYLGNFSCGSWEIRQNEDKAGDTRQVLIFHLIPLGVESQVGLEASEQNSPRTSGSESLLELRNKAIEASTAVGPTNPKDGKRRFYERSVDVRRYVLMRASGICEVCLKAAPFKRSDGTPYLEPHHTHRVSDGGPDHPRWVGAICPNCHRQIHCGVNGENLNHQLQKYLDQIEQ